MKKLLLLALCALLTVALLGCAPSAPKRERVTEDAPVYDPEDIYTETTAEEATLHGRLVAVCGENLLRVELFQNQAELIAALGETVYVRVSDTADVASWCEGDGVFVTYDTVERSKDPKDLPVVVAKKAHIELPAYKPVIYLYPETPTEVSVSLTLSGRLTCTYPDYEADWKGFTAHPDGTLTFPNGKEYYCLYWEGMQATEWDFSRGFCVKGEDTAAFLEWALAEQGLTAREANEFIIYWLPLMQENPYNVISFQTEAYTSTAVLDVTPTPDSTIRIMMAYYPSDEAVEILPQHFETPVREGFTVVEWGGSRVEKP
jgi:hypothetical protein